MVTPVLTGFPVSGCSYLERPVQAGYFIFPDLSVRHEGYYRLVFTLYEQVKDSADEDEDDNGETGFYNRMAIKSKEFTVWSAKKFPGLASSTELSRVVAEQGCRVRIRRDVRMRKRNGDDKGGKSNDAGNPTKQESQTPVVAHHRSISSSSSRRPSYEFGGPPVYGQAESGAFHKPSLPYQHSNIQPAPPPITPTSYGSIRSAYSPSLPYSPSLSSPTPSPGGPGHMSRHSFDHKVPKLEPDSSRPASAYEVIQSKPTLPSLQSLMPQREASQQAGSTVADRPVSYSAMGTRMVPGTPGLQQRAMLPPIAAAPSQAPANTDQRLRGLYPVDTAPPTKRPRDGSRLEPCEALKDRRHPEQNDMTAGFEPLSIMDSHENGYNRREGVVWNRVWNPATEYWDLHKTPLRYGTSQAPHG